MSDLILARELAFKFHAGQRYGAADYTVHLCAVAGVAAEFFPNDERLQILAWLHDILEDTDCTVAILRALFEDNIVEAVIAITRCRGESKEAYAARVKANPLATKGKKCDSFCNLRESLKRGDMRRVVKYSAFIGEMASW